MVLKVRSQSASNVVVFEQKLPPTLCCLMCVCVCVGAGFRAQTQELCVFTWWWWWMPGKPWKIGVSSVESRMRNEVKEEGKKESGKTKSEIKHHTHSNGGGD